MRKSENEGSDEQTDRQTERNDDFDDTRNNVAKIAWQPWSNNNGHKMALKLPTHLPTCLGFHFSTCARFDNEKCACHLAECVCVGVCMSVYRVSVCVKSCLTLRNIFMHFDSTFFVRFCSQNDKNVLLTEKTTAFSTSMESYNLTGSDLWGHFHVKRGVKKYSFMWIEKDVRWRWA